MSSKPQGEQLTSNEVACEHPQLFIQHWRLERVEPCMYCERVRLQQALKKYGRHTDGCRTRDWTVGEKSWDAETCDCGLAQSLMGECSSGDYKRADSRAPEGSVSESPSRPADETTGEQK